MRFSVLLLTTLAAGCGMPHDPDGTLDRVRGGTMRVGIAPREPWTRLEDGQPAGVEVELLRVFAGDLGAKIQWTARTESELLEALEKQELDVVIAGLTDETPWKDRVGLTRPYLKVDFVVGVPAGEPVPQDIQGREVAILSNPFVAGLVRKKGGNPVPKSDVSSGQYLAAGERERVLAWGLAATDITLHEEKHVMAVPNGENGWLLALDRFLLDREAKARDLLRAEVAR